MDLLSGFFSSVPLHWRIVLIASVLVIAAVCLRALETEETRTKRAGQRKSKELLRKRPDAVVTALNLLLNQQKVQKAPLTGYWRLNS